MKKILMILSMLILPILCFAGSEWDQTQVIDQGRYIATKNITLTTHTAVNIYNADMWDSNGDIFNNSAYTIWIGSNTSTLQQTGFPILSSTTYTLGGRCTSDIYGTVDSAAAGNVINAVKTIRYKMQ